MAEYETAIENFTTAIELDPYYENHYLWRGYAYRRLDNREQAIADFEQVLALTDDDETKADVEGLLTQLKQ
ncbi:MAG: tetratricopeptide repeat protein [Caldilineaceae bacterium]